MTESIAIVAIVGSLRADSFNRAVFNAASQLVGDGVALREILLHDVPLYDGDLEKGGDPAAVAALKSAVDEADAVIVFTPEYNRSVPAVTKNAIDWLSRLPGESALSRATVGLVAATPGRHDAAGVRDHLGTSIAANTDRFYGTTLGIASVTRKMIDGALADDVCLAELQAWLAGFVDYVRSPAES